VIIETLLFRSLKVNTRSLKLPEKGPKRTDIRSRLVTYFSLLKFMDKINNRSRRHNAFCQSSRLFPNFRDAWDMIKTILSKPWPLEPPLECRQYVDYVERFSEADLSRLLVIMFISFTLVLTLVIWGMANVNYAVLKDLFEATPYEREKELKRLCKPYGIKFENDRGRYKDEEKGYSSAIR
jgi:hypothetical protein